MQTPVLIRENYLQRLVVWIDKPIIKVIIGQRRVGKSMFLFQIMDYIKKDNPEANIIYINTEEEEYQQVRDYTALQNTVNSRLLSGIGTSGQAIYKLFTGDFQGAWESAKEGVSGIFRVDALKNAYEGGKQLGDAFKAKIHIKQIIIKINPR